MCGGVRGTPDRLSPVITCKEGLILGCGHLLWAMQVKKPKFCSVWLFKHD